MTHPDVQQMSDIYLLGLRLDFSKLMEHEGEGEGLAAGAGHLLRSGFRLLKKQLLKVDQNESDVWISYSKVFVDPL